jgi:hypothetical protein
LDHVKYLESTLCRFVPHLTCNILEIQLSYQDNVSHARATVHLDDLALNSHPKGQFAVETQPEQDSCGLELGLLHVQGGRGPGLEHVAGLPVFARSQMQMRYVSRDVHLGFRMQAGCRSVAQATAFSWAAFCGSSLVRLPPPPPSPDTLLHTLTPKGSCCCHAVVMQPVTSVWRVGRDATKSKASPLAPEPPPSPGCSVVGNLLSPPQFWGGAVKCLVSVTSGSNRNSTSNVLQW